MIMMKKEYNDLKKQIQANIDNITALIYKIREEASEVLKTRYNALFRAVKRHSAFDRPTSEQFANVRTAFEFGLIAQNQFDKIQKEFVLYRTDAYYNAIKKAVLSLIKSKQSEEQKLKNLEIDFNLKGNKNV